MSKTGSQHAQSLNDGRQVFINGQLVANVGEHPAFRRTAQTIGGSIVSYGCLYQTALVNFGAVEISTP